MMSNEEDLHAAMCHYCLWKAAQQQQQQGVGSNSAPAAAAAPQVPPSATRTTTTTTTPASINVPSPSISPATSAPNTTTAATAAASIVNATNATTAASTSATAPNAATTTTISPPAAAAAPPPPAGAENTTTTTTTPAAAGASANINTTHTASMNRWLQMAKLLQEETPSLVAQKAQMTTAPGTPPPYLIARFHLYPSLHNDLMNERHWNQSLRYQVSELQRMVAAASSSSSANYQHHGSAAAAAAGQQSASASQNINNNSTAVKSKKRKSPPAATAKGGGGRGATTTTTATGSAAATPPAKKKAKSGSNSQHTKTTMTNNSKKYVNIASRTDVPDDVKQLLNTVRADLTHERRQIKRLQTRVEKVKAGAKKIRAEKNKAQKQAAAAVAAALKEKKVAVAGKPPLETAPATTATAAAPAATAATSNGTTTAAAAAAENNSNNEHTSVYNDQTYVYKPRKQKPPGPAVPWDDRLKELEHFYKGHGHCRVPIREPGLGRWVAEVRKHYRILQSLEEWDRNEQLDLKPDKPFHLTHARVAILNGMNFEWRPMAQPVPFEVRYQQLVDYKAKHGHLRIPRSCNEPAGLGEFVYNQRKNYKQKAKVMEQRTDKLNAIGFIWDTKIYKPSFEERLEECREFRRAHGHLSVPVPDYKDDYNKKKEKMKQQAARKGGAGAGGSGSSSNGNNDEESVQAVNADNNNNGTDSKNDETNNAEPVSGDGSGGDNGNRAGTDEDADQQQQGGQKSGKISEKEKSFRSWAQRMRVHYQLFNEGNKSSLDKRRINALTDLGFDWSAQGRMKDRRCNHQRYGLNREQAYKTQLDKLRHVKSLYGDISDPRNIKAAYPGDESLLIWMKNQRKQYKNKRKGLWTSLTTERHLALDALGFDFEPYRDHAPYGSLKNGAAAAAEEEEEEEEEAGDEDDELQQAI